jgi:hypothetical protein
VCLQRYGNRTLVFIKQNSEKIVQCLYPKIRYQLFSNIHKIYVILVMSKVRASQIVHMSESLG